MRVTGDLTRLNAVRYPDKTALIMDGAALSYAALDRRSNQLANALIAMGAAPGDRVALLAYNSPDFAVAAQAAAKAGALLVPLNFRFKAQELAFVLQDSAPKILISERAFAQTLAQAAALAGSSPALIFLDDGAVTQPEDAPSVQIDPDDPCVIMYTSGATGFPKGVLVSHAAYFKMYCAHAIEMRLTHEDVYLLAVPMFHAAGLNMALHQCLFMGATGIVHRGSFDVRAIFQLIQTHRISFAILTPASLGLMAAHPDLHAYDLSSLTRVVYGSMPISAPVLKAALAAFPNVRFTQIYGSTEAGNVAVLRHEDHARWPQTTGRASLLTESRIVDDQGRDVAAGGVGEIIVRQASMGMKGYWRNPAADSTALKDGWIYTGDLARVEPEGLFTIVDRRSDVIISGGENIYPKEIENALHAHPAVQACAAFGLHDPIYGEKVCAAVVLKPGFDVAPDALIAACAQSLADYKRPKMLRIIADLPRNAADKVQKSALKKLFTEQA